MKITYLHHNVPVALFAATLLSQGAATISAAAPKPPLPAIQLAPRPTSRLKHDSEAVRAQLGWHGQRF
jgi:hypothetical protein